MDIETFGKYIQKSQAENFHGQRKKEYVQELAEELFEIRKGVQMIRTTEREIRIEQAKTAPDKTKIRNLKIKAIVESAPAYDAMHEINRKTVEATGMRTFHLSRRYALSGTAVKEFKAEAASYMESLEARITQNPSRFIPGDKENTQYEDKLYVESFLQGEMIRERVRELPDNSKTEFRISSFEELNKIINKRKEEEPQHTQHTRHKGTNFER